jgi:hypothetical protein
VSFLGTFLFLKSARRIQRTMLEEVNVAAKWWTLQIQTRPTDNAADFERRKAIFERAFAKLLSQRCSRHWYPKDARRASAFRTVVNDLRCDRILMQAAEKAGIDDIALRVPQGMAGSSTCLFSRLLRLTHRKNILRPWYYGRSPNVR